MNRRYPHYKPSGADWIGDVPDDWRVVPLNNIAKVINGFPFDAALFSPDEGYPLVRIRDLGKIDTESRFSGDFLPAAAITSDDVLIGMDGDFNIGRWRGEGEALLNQRMCCIRGVTPLVTRLLEYALARPLEAINEVTHSTTVKHLSSVDVKKIRVPLPSEERELLSLVEFLDRETGKIDALVAEQRRLIELLKEKRQAVISHAITKGLNPNAEMKPSGVRWLGDVPEHWAVCALAYRYEVALGKMLDEKKITGQHLGPYLRNSDVQWGKINTVDLPMMDFSGGDLIRYSLAPGDLLVCEGGEVGRAAVWRGELEECFYQKALHRLRPHHADQDDVDYLFFTMVAAASSGVFAGSEGKSTIAHLPAEAFRRYQFPFPPKAEQTAIVARLSTELQELDRLIELSEAACALLRERRTALISAVVTGKIDVQNKSGSVLALSDTARLRAVVAAEIVDLLSHKKSFGRVKLQKLLYLAEAHAGIGELQGQYLREAAGPLDRTLMAEVDAGLQQDQYVKVIQPDEPRSQVVYHLQGKRGAYHDELVATIGDRATSLRALVEKLGDLDTKSVEAVTTLYAVWNDELLDDRAPTDATVVSGVLEDWHPEKAQKFRAEELQTWLGWMRRNKLVPRGNGPRTTTGRLFV